MQRSDLAHCADSHGGCAHAALLLNLGNLACAAMGQAGTARSCFAYVRPDVDLAMRCREIAPVKYVWTQLAAPNTWRRGTGNHT
jgi:hypothetical protein